MECQDAIKKIKKGIEKLRKELEEDKSGIKTSQNEFFVCDDTMKIDILGTEYTIETHKVSEDSFMEKKVLQAIAEKKTS